MSKNLEFYKKLKLQLEDTTNFPSDYLYKFIVPAIGNQANQIEEIFDNTGAIINTKMSKTGKYVSVSILVNLESASQVIDFYKKTEKIEGIISL